MEKENHSHLNKLNIVGVALLLFFIALACGGEQSPTNDVQKPVAQKVEAKDKKPKKVMSEGERLFLLCQACHSLNKGEDHKTGPNLYGFFGRKAGTAEGYGNYSDAIKNSGIIWDEEQLKNWLTKPTDFLPGTSMAFIGIPDEKKQDALIAYLKEQTQ